jgi:hypothetical protein
MTYEELQGLRERAEPWIEFLARGDEWGEWLQDLVELGGSNIWDCSSNEFKEAWAKEVRDALALTRQQATGENADYYGYEPEEVTRARAIAEHEGDLLPEISKD